MIDEEKKFQYMGKNKLPVPLELLENAVELRQVRTLSVKVSQPFNRLYTLWKPSHFYTGLEVHSAEVSWRTFRIDSCTFSAVKMYLVGDHLMLDVFSNVDLSDEQLVDLRKNIIYSYGLQEDYDLPTKIVTTNSYVSSIFPKLEGTRISCPESIFEIAIVSLLLQNTSISRTTSMFHNLMKRYGRVLFLDGIALYTFYLPEDFHSATERELKEYCRLGYRAKYIKNYADFFQANKEGDLRRLGKDNLLLLLKTIKGVGDYTSNIIASSALRDKQAVPFDSWNRKILSARLYGVDNIEAQSLKVRIFNDFGDYAGLISMYVIESEYMKHPVVPLM